MKIKKPSWRDDSGIERKILYIKKFAIFPVKCCDGTRVWFKNFYKKYEQYGGYGYDNGDRRFFHTDFIENVSEAEYIIRRLVESH